MSLIQTMLESHYVQRLGWALLHSLWQGAAVSLVLILFLLLARKASPQIRYVASCGAMLAVLFLPILTFCRLQPVPEPLQPNGVAQHEGLALSPSPVAGPSSAAPPPIVLIEPVIVRQRSAPVDSVSHAPRPAARSLWSGMIDSMQHAIPWLVLAWLCGVAGLSLWNLGGWVAIQRLKVISTGTVSEEIRDLADRLRRRVGLHRAVRLLTSARVISPMVIGVFKPVILLPASALSGLSPAQLESILAHELAHVRRHDYLVNLIQSVIETLMFYHPAVWWIGRRIRVERENCCDDVALSLTRDRVTYASALALVACRAPGLAPSASGGVLLARVRRILGRPASDIVGAPRWLSGALVLAVAVALCAVLHPQSPAASAAAKPPQTQPTMMALTILDQDTGQPLEGVHISTSSHEKIPQATTDVDGHATLQLPRKDLSMNVWARKDGYVPMVAMWNNTKGEDPIPASFTIKIERGQTIGGKVVDEQGTPVAGAAVYVNALRYDRSRQRVSTQVYDDKFTTDANGQWRCGIIPKDATQVALRLEHPDYASDAIYGQSGNPSMDELRKASDVLVLKKGVTVKGQVVDVQGKPIDGALVALGQRARGLHAPTARSDGGGHFVLQHCRLQDQAELVVTAKGRCPAVEQFALRSDRSDVLLHLKPAKPLIVRVVDPKGRPLPNSRFFIQQWRGGNLIDWDTHADAQGLAVWNEAPDDTVYYCISHDGYIQLVQAPLTATGAEQTVTLFPIIRISGSVLDDQTGRPVEHYRVINGWTSYRNAPLWERDNEQTPPEHSGGRFELTEDLERDGYAIRIEADGYLPAESKILHGQDGDQTFTFRLKAAAEISQTLHASDGKPLADADMLVVNASSQIIIDDGAPTRQTYTLRTKTDSDGHFRLPPQSGEYRLMVLHPQGFAELSPKDLGGTAPIVVPPWAAVEGIARVGSKPASGHTVVAMPDEKDRQERGRITISSKSTVSDDGHFRIEHVVPGSVDVAFYVELASTTTSSTYGYAQRQKFEAKAGQTARVELGGLGRPVVGRVVVPTALAGQINWTASRYDINSRLHLPGRVLPADWKQMDAKAKAQWEEQWRQSPDVRRYDEELKTRKYYPVKLEPDGSFRVDDVQAGTYDFQVQAYDGSSPLQLIGSAKQEFTVDPMPGGRSDQPLDIGSIGMSTNKAPKQ